MKPALIEHPDLYCTMPEEQRIRRCMADGRATWSDIEVLLELAGEKGNRAETVRLLLRLFRVAPVKAVAHGDLFLTSMWRSLRCFWTRRIAVDRPLRLAFFYQQPYFLQTMRSVVAAADAHDTLTSRDPDEVIAYRPDALLSPQADPRDILRLRRALPICLFIYLRHGLAHKTNAVPTAGYYDKVCVSSAAGAETFLRVGGFPRSMVWQTGYPQCDDLMVAGRRSRGRTILYAPTHNEGLSSASWIEPENFRQLMERASEWHLRIKLHPNQHGSPAWERWKAFGHTHPRVTFLDEPMTDVAVLLASADLLISDFSSLAFLFLAVDRPIVLLTPPAAGSARNRDPDGIEWLWRDMAEEVTDLAAFADVVTRCLEQPDQRKDRRSLYRSRLFGQTLDGNCGRRVISKVEAQFGIPAIPPRE